MDHLPLFLRVAAQRVVIVGGGEVAARKARLVSSAGASITLVAPQLCVALADLVREGAMAHISSNFTPAHLDGARLVIAATDDRGVNASVAAAAQAQGLWINVVDDAELSTALMPSIVDRSPVIVAVSTGGASPVLARRLRETLETVLEESLGPVAAMLSRWRARIVTRWPEAGARRRAIDALLDGEVGGLAARHQYAAAEMALQRAVDRVGSAAETCVGRVTLVGAGPGDPGLLTLKALRALQRADVVLHDRLVSAEILTLARRDADLVDVGKMGGCPSTPQERIHELLLQFARAGRNVVRLKGGDPFVFGRGGEEIETLRAAGIPYEVVPGITTALGLATAAIPLTHRGLSAGVRLVTAQRAVDGTEPDWKSWAEGRDTLVIYMGTSVIARVRRELLRHGLDAATPLAFVEHVSEPNQRVVLGTLNSAETLAATHGLGSPSIVVLGPVAALAAQWHWFGTPPETLFTDSEHAA